VVEQGEGVGFVAGGTEYLFAETTKAVPLGWIADDMRDLAKWIAVTFD
jgi:hypothetical protein